MAGMEGAAWLSLKIYYQRLGQSSLPTAFDNEKLYYQEVRYDPYRWYRLSPNYSGHAVQTDWLGFRNSPASLSEVRNDRVAMYGGSTIFSTTTEQEFTLPSLLQKKFSKGPQFLNFGLGGYASSAELSAFLETIRLIPGIRTAIFYDGVNEVARYAEKMQDGREEPEWQAVSYPYQSVLEAVLTGKNASTGYVEFPFTKFLAEKAIQKFRQNQDDLAGADYVKAAEVITSIYLNNVRDIDAIAKARGIRAVFVLQPVIYTTENLSPAEAGIAAAKYKVDLPRLYLLTYPKLRAALADAGVAFLDMSEVLSAKSPEISYYTDMCHLNAEGQKYLSDKMARVLMTKYPRVFRGED